MRIKNVTKRSEQQDHQDTDMKEEKRERDSHHSSVKVRERMQSPDHDQHYGGVDGSTRRPLGRARRIGGRVEVAARASDGAARPNQRSPHTVNPRAYAPHRLQRHLHQLCLCPRWRTSCGRDRRRAWEEERRACGRNAAAKA